VEVKPLSDLETTGNCGVIVHSTVFSIFVQVLQYFLRPFERFNSTPFKKESIIIWRMGRFVYLSVLRRSR
jgi:hypothetical protein